MSDDFARRSAARAWQAVLETQKTVDELQTRLTKLEKPKAPDLNRCGYCGAWTTGVVCRNHVDLLAVGDVLKKARRSATDHGDSVG